MSYLGEDIKKLGFGLMRLPQLEDGKIDIEQTKQMVDLFLEAGFTYFDTAWAYAGSEDAIRQALVERYPRDRFILATKNAAWINCKTREDAIAQFETSLKQTGAGYFDFYLLHNLGEGRTHFFDDFDLWSWVQEKKKEGKIKHVGFSFHSTPEELEEILNKHPEMEFVQLQINYADWEAPAIQAKACYEVARKHGKPVIIMEPLRGGRLVNLLPESAKELFAQDEEHRTPAELALKWLYDQPEGTCVLSGMNSMEMVEQNVRTASEYGVGCMTESDRALVEAVRQEITKHVKVGCTGCGYCMPCPRGVDIPGTFRCYNAMYSEGKKSGRRDYLQCTAFRKNPASASQCVGCGKCEQHCPQHIEIRRELKAAAGELETVKYKFMKTAIGVLKLW